METKISRMWINTMGRMWKCFHWERRTAEKSKHFVLCVWTSPAFDKQYVFQQVETQPEDIPPTLRSVFVSWLSSQMLTHTSPFCLPPVEKRQDALPDCSHHQLPGSLHLHGGVAHRLLPFPLSKVGSFFLFGHCQGCWGRVGGPSERNPGGILDVTGHVSALKIPRFQSASRSYWGKTVWSWDETFPISILQM